ncbi:MAG: HAD family hydrolase [Candidatus Rokuibacteriota bacterium]
MTVDFWGTLLFDGPGSDDRYRAPRLNEFEAILKSEGVPMSRSALERGYTASAVWLGKVWSRHRDVPVVEHVRAVLAAEDRGLPDRLSPAAMAALVEAYARPLLRVPPTVDDGALAALTTLRARGYTLALVSNTMRTPGMTLRKLLAMYRLLDCFAHTTFSDEVGVRKPDPQIFALTLNAVAGEAMSAVHVGDDAVLDVQGARAAGMRVIQVTGRPPASATSRPDAVIPSLKALPDAVEQLEA